MSWNRKSNIIAASVLKKMEKNADGLYTREEVLKGLYEAAIDGMRYECDLAVMPLLRKLNEKN